MRSDSYERIWAVVRRIPKGRVATYGQIATMAGFARQPRLAGYAMHNVPPGESLAWHRVINAKGRISFPRGSRQFREQKRRLEDEGVVFVRGRVDLSRWRWQTRGDAPVLD
jgi:methylated-DNA-protein-cysteine methyltransferase-like protein